MKKATTTITERQYILISRGLSHLINEYDNMINKNNTIGNPNNNQNLERTIKEINDLRNRLASKLK